MDRIDTTRLTFILRLRDRQDQFSWQEFHQRYGELLYRYARSRGANHADAEDIVQEVEMYLFKAMDGFNYDAAKGRFRSYLRSSVVHAMGRRASKKAGQGQLLDPRDFDHLAANLEAGDDAHWDREWQLHRLRWALRSIADEFAPGTRQTFQLHVLMGKSAEEVAEVQGISTASVYQAKSRILKRVRERLAELDPDEDV